jgi:uncharacterized protein (DUF1330 family)
MISSAQVRIRGEHENVRHSGFVNVRRCHNWRWRYPSSSCAGQTPAYVVIEADVKDQAGFAKEYIPFALKALGAGTYGYKVLARNGKTVSLDGTPPKKRVIINALLILIMRWPHIALPNNAARAVGRKYADIRMFAVEGVSQ